MPLCECGGTFGSFAGWPQGLAHQLPRSDSSAASHDRYLVAR